MSKFRVGDRYGDWTVLAPYDVSTKKVLCQCVCGGQKSVDAGSLLRGVSKSCGRCGKMVERRNQAMLEKYGETHPLRIPQFKDLARQANRARLGVDNPAKSSVVQAKIRETMRERSGYDNAFQIPEIRKRSAKAAWTPLAQKKRINTSIGRFGTPHPMQSKVLQQKTRETLIKKYGVDNFSKTPEFREAFSIKNPMKNPAIRARFYDALEAKYGVRRLTELESFKQAVTKHKIEGDSLRQYLLAQKIEHVQYNAVRNVLVSHGKKAALEYIEKRRNERLSSLELFFSKEIIPIEKFDRKVIEGKGWRPDFKLSDSVFVNVDSLYYHSEIFRDRNYHMQMRKDFEHDKKRIFQFYSDEVLTKPLIVKSILENALGKSKKIYARKCDVVPIRSAIAARLLDEWHLMGRGAPSHCLALAEKNEDIAAVLTYRMHQGGVEISRFASRLGCSVVGGFGKLVAALAALIPGKKIISFCDMRYATGRSYLALGFKLQSEHLSFYWTDFVRRFNRRYCRSENGKSEREQAQAMGLVKIFDAGQIKFILD